LSRGCPEEHLDQKRGNKQEVRGTRSLKSFIIIIYATDYYILQKKGDEMRGKQEKCFEILVGKIKGKKVLGN
jgi:hypothetical protein